MPHCMRHFAPTRQGRWGGGGGGGGEVSHIFVRPLTRFGLNLTTLGKEEYYNCFHKSQNSEKVLGLDC